MSSRSLDDEFSALEARIGQLLDRCTRLAAENRSLRDQQDGLVEERARLIEKNESARGKVAQMIDRLKSLEASQ